MNYVKYLLLEKKMTTQALADLAGVNKRSLEPYITGKASWRNARAHMLLSVADALGVDPRDLVDSDIQVVVKQKKRQE